jgi:fermentation-respiration switch protein FrsA (DUF1100 family)
MLKRFLLKLWGSKHLGWRVSRILILLVVGILTYIMTFESSFIYFPSKYPEGNWQIGEPRVVEDSIVAHIEDVQLTARDGTHIHGWYCTPQVGRGGALALVETDRVLLYLHGNGGNLTHRRDIVERLVGLKLNVLIIDYRGYGRSEGAPSEEGLYADARAAWDYLTNTRGIPGGRIVIYGESLGGAVAVDLASKVKPCGLIVQSSFTSIADMAAELMPLVPRFVIRTKMDSREKIARVSCPKLFVHSPADDVVPYKLGRRLFEAAPEPKRFYEIKGAPHNLTYEIGGAPYLDALKDFIDSACGAPRS